MFRLFGFDVRVQLGFVIFLAFVAFLYPQPLGFWVAGCLAGFTLLHELGHALAARSAGADASISLGFMAGYTSFQPSPLRPIGRARRAIISAAGPLIQIVAGVLVLVALGADPLRRPSFVDSDAVIAVWWAGIAVGVLNLIPVLPLDGGHLLQIAVQPIFGQRTLPAMAIFSLGVTLSAAAWMLLNGNSNFALFIGFLLIGQFQLLQSTSTKPVKTHQQSHELAAAAEAAAWQTGKPGLLEPGQTLSPWFRAYQALEKGDSPQAVQPVLNDLTSSTTGNWAPPAAATTQQLSRVVALLPDPLPAGNARSEQMMCRILLTVGQVQRAGHYAVGTFERHGGSVAAMVVARAAARMGDIGIAEQWIMTGIEAAQSEPVSTQQEFVNTLEYAPELASVRSTWSVQRALASLPPVAPASPFTPPPSSPPTSPPSTPPSTPPTSPPGTQPPTTPPQFPPVRPPS